MKVRTVTCNFVVFSCAVLSAPFLGPRAVAATWGSIRANNREPHEESRGGGRPLRGHEEGVARNHEAAPEIRREPERHVEVPRREIRHDYRERRHVDIDAELHHGFFWHDFHPGMILNTLPPGYVQVYVGSNPYYYDQGVYYQTTPSGYAVVTPPPGAIVPVLPPGAEAIPVGPAVYYYAAGAFYVQQPQGYVVVAPPAGVTVTTLPPGAVPVIIRGMQYYQADGVYFMPVMENGVVAYTVVQP